MTEKKVNFYHAYKTRPAEEANCGSKLRDKKVLKYDEDGIPSLVVVGQTDQYAVIQSFRDECDINVILDRYLMGDVNALQKAQGLYMSALSVPTDLRSALALEKKVEKFYNSLDDKIKSKFKDVNEFKAKSFDNDFMSYFAENIIEEKADDKQ